MSVAGEPRPPRPWEEGVAPGSQPARATGAQSRPRVLIVDDDDELAGLLRDLLDEEGYAVATATDGAAALEMATTHDPALIVLDLRMPNTDGRRFAIEYRENGGRARILLLTALGAAATQAPIPGVDFVVAKPFDIDGLLERIARLVHPAASTRPRSAALGRP